jgi:PAS domain S-box-containing protein
MLQMAGIEVLLVDDSEFFRTVVSDKLDAEDDIRVRTVDGGPAALEAVADGGVACVVSDFEMPEMTGLELFDRIDAEYDLPFVLLTGQGDERIASRAIGAGVDDYLSKDEIAEGGQLELLANRIKNVVAQRRAQQKYERLVNNTPDEILEVGLDGTVVAANEAAARSFGTTQSDLVGQYLADVLPKATAAERLEHGRKALTAGSAMTFQDGYGVRSFHNIAVPVGDGDGETFQLITRDITQQKRREQELENRTEELAVINRLVRHDINNDIQLLTAWADGLDTHVEGGGEEYVTRIHETCNHIVELTEIAKDFVDSISGGDDVEVGTVALSPILDAEIEKIRRTASDVTVSVEDELPTVPVRANELLSSVFGNLLSNAVRHNDADDPRVWIGVETTDTRVRVRVADNGPGVPDDRKEDIFGKGERGPDSPGTGLGLYLVYTLVDQYDGRVWVEDRTEPRAGDQGSPTGATFVVELSKQA